jgi:hypothetical protein
MSSNSKTVKIFLLQGDPTGVKIVQLMNWTGKAYVIPRIQIESVSKRTELKSQCVYFLIGQDPEGNTTVYVGEAEEFIVRIKQHESKDWNYAIPFFSKDENLTKSHVKFLESIFHEKLKNAGRVKIENNIFPTRPKLPEEDISDMELFQENAELMLSAIGYNFFEPPTTFISSLNIANTENRTSNEIEEVLSIVTKSKSTKKIFKANGIFTNEGFVLLADSEVTIDPAMSEPASATRRRKNEEKIGNLVPSIDKDGVKYNLLVKDILFGSPSMAAVFVMGYSIYGRIIWKNREGKTLSEIKR